MNPRAPKDLDWTEHLDGRESTFVLAPSRLEGIPILVFASLWDSFFVMLWMGLSRAHAPPRAFLFAVAHAVVGLVLTYLALVRCMNVIRITLGPDALSVTQSPIPTRGKRLSTPQIDRFDVPEASARKKRPVRAVMKGGRPPVDFVFMLEGLDEVMFVAARLNSALAALRSDVTPAAT